MADESGGDFYGGVIETADVLERVLRPVGNFITEKVTDKTAGDLVGPALGVPQTLAGLGPEALEQLGYGPGDELYDQAADLAQEFDVDYLPPLRGDEFGDRVRIEVAPDPAPPPGEVIVFGIVDP